MAYIRDIFLVVYFIIYRNKQNLLDFSINKFLGIDPQAHTQTQSPRSKDAAAVI